MQISLSFYAFAQPAALPVVDCYYLPNRDFVDIKGIRIDTNKFDCNDKGPLPNGSAAQSEYFNCYRRPDGVVVDVLNQTKEVPLTQCRNQLDSNQISAASATAQAQRQYTDNTPSSLNLCKDTGLIAKIPCEMWAFASTIILGIMAGLSAMSATIFDIVMQKFVLQISTLFTNSNPNMDYIYSAWTVIRDLGNIIAFFGAVYMGFRYIIGKDDLDFKKAVMKLVFYSLMVNFSFPIAKFLIDISNVVSLQIYGGIVKYQVGGGELKNMIMQSVGVTSLVSEVGKINTSIGNFNSFTVLWLAIIYLFLTFGVFLYASLQIIIRAFILIACVIFSPIMFLNFAFPKITELHEKWRENFFGQLVFMPMLMIGFWLSFTLLNVATGSNSLESQINVTEDTLASSLIPIVNMSLAIVALIMGIKLSSAASGSVGKYASGVVGGAMKEVGLGVATGGAGSLARMSIGKMGAKMAASKWVGATGENNGALRRMSASVMTNVGGKMAGFSAFGKDSYKVKTEKTLTQEKTKIKSEDVERLRATGLGKLVDEAKTPEELKKVREEMEKREKDTNPKNWNRDVLGRAEAKRKKDAEQALLREMRDSGVASNLRATFRVEDQELKKQERELADLSKKKESELAPAESLQKQRLEALIKERKDRIENEIKGTSVAYKVGTAIGDTAGDARVGVSRAKDAVLDATGVTGAKRAIGRGLDAAGKAVAEFADRPSIIASTKNAAAKSLRAKLTGREVERADELKKMDQDKANYKNQEAVKVVAGGNDDGKAAANSNNATGARKGLSFEA